MSVHLHFPHIHKSPSPLDRLVAVVAVLGPLLGIPQVYEIYTTQNASGLSLLAWLGFTFYTLVFLAYGIKHNIKPLIITQSLWLAIYVLVTAGVVIHG